MKKLLVLFVLSWFYMGCAAMATKGKLAEVDLSTFSKPAQKTEILYRTYKIAMASIDGKGAYLWSATDIKAMLEKDLQSMGESVHAVEYEAVVDSSFYGEGYEKQVEKVLKINFPVKADYFLDVEQREKPMLVSTGEGMMFWGMFHVLSLGLIPYRGDNDVKLIITLYDKNGKVLQREEIEDESKVWAWTPLFFVNGFHLIRKFDDVAAPVRKNALENGLLRLKF